MDSDKIQNAETVMEKRRRENEQKRKETEAKRKQAAEEKKQKVAAAAEARKQAAEQLKAKAAAAAEARKQEVEKKKQEAVAAAEARKREAEQQRQKQAQEKAANKVLGRAKDRATLSLGPLNVGKRSDDEGKMSSTKPLKVAPRGVPILSKWSQNGDGSITGEISGSNAYKDRETITTSEIIGNAVESSVVRTRSGSRYVFGTL